MSEQRKQVAGKIPDTLMLLPHVSSTAQIYLVEKDPNVPGQNRRIQRMDRPQKVPVHLTFSFSKKDGKRVTTRYLRGAKSIFQDEQIKEGYPANIKVSFSDRQGTEFFNGLKVLADDFDKEFFSHENNPQHIRFEGVRPPNITPIFDYFDPTEKEHEEHQFMGKQADAMREVFSADFTTCSGLIAILFGPAEPVPDDLKTAQNKILRKMNDGEAVIDRILEGVRSKDDKILVTISDAIKSGVLNFDDKEYIKIKRNSNLDKMKLLVNPDYNARIQALQQWLAGEEGSVYLKEIETILSNNKKK